MVHFRPEYLVHFTPVQVVHIGPESLVHFAPVEVVHYTPVCSAIALPNEKHILIAYVSAYENTTLMAEKLLKGYVNRVTSRLMCVI